MTPLPPGPDESPLLQTLRWLLRPIAFLEASRRRFGDAFSVRFLGFETPMVMVSDPEAVRALYSERAHGLPPGRTVSLQPIMGARSVLLLEGAEHLSRRRVMLPPFHGDRMRAYEPIVREAAEREIDGWPAGPFAVHPRMQAVTLEVILRAVFGVADAQRRAVLRAGLADLLGATSSVGLQLAVLAVAPAAAARTRWRGCTSAWRRSTGSCSPRSPSAAPTRHATAEREDICSLLVRARFEDGAEMPDQEVRDQLMTLLLAGHETTATALAWTLDLLTRHPAALARLQAEVDAGEEDRWLRAVIAESLRLRPVIPLAGRRLDGAAARRRARPARRHRRHAGHLAHPHARRPVPGALRVPARALPRPRAVDLRVDPVRRRRAPLPRRLVRGDGDAAWCCARSSAGARCGRRERAPSAWRGAT